MMAQSTPGQLIVLTGSMFSGKTENLILRLLDIAKTGRRVHVFKPSLDTRYAVASVVSHSGMKTAATPVPVTDPMRILELVDDPIRDHIDDAVGIDEAQFFKDDLFPIVDRLVNRGATVLAAGLDLDYTGAPFGVMPHLMALADEVVKLTALCTTCNAPASRTQRLTQSHDLVEIGASEKYAARCRLHFSAP